MGMCQTCYLSDYHKVCEFFLMTKIIFLEKMFRQGRVRVWGGRWWGGRGKLRVVWWYLEDKYNIMKWRVKGS